MRSRDGEGGPDGPSPIRRGAPRWTFLVSATRDPTQKFPRYTTYEEEGGLGTFGSGFCTMKVRWQSRQT